MNEKEIAEIRRRFRPEKSNISHIRGCYVNEKREVISQFDQPLSMMSEEDAEKILSILKKTLSGTLGKNLMDIEFMTQQVLDGPEHKQLMTLRSSALKDEEAVQAFFDTAIQSLDIEGNYLIMLAYDVYDVPYRSADGQRLEDAASDTFSYILCSVCPVKLTKPALSYYVQDSQFHSREPDWVLAAPELGFMFPAFDDRSANIYSALYYTRSAAEVHDGFVDAVFCCQPPMPAAAQKETFGAVLGETLAEDCSFEVVQAVSDELCQMIETHKVNKEEEPLRISKYTVKRVLEGCGLPPERTQAFVQQYDEAFGKDADLSPKNIVDVKQFEIRTPNVVVRTAPACSHLVETRVIDGSKYILIRAEDGVEVNGVNITLHGGPAEQ
ncbi:DUF4317 domain-containing protein [Neobittarella massiliensis]|uniref:DUF4317 domain-containing protein n=2 Tax=Oscillospiraceae TaxID=216572 RepID=A0A8J6IN63_9FIRM|nr:DUF4317 domain-containing protein [Neobittarella massiliensis]MBC3515907.1 DUF4317 domain-containing protein [Neobittarella massiliensis]SCJ42758.1 Uncharacterised protein [uncultured Anaerotruncus sp.]